MQGFGFAIVGAAEDIRVWIVEHLRSALRRLRRG
jgi:hypothetical protein